MTLLYYQKSQPHHEIVQEPSECVGESLGKSSDSSFRSLAVVTHHFDWQKDGLGKCPFSSSEILLSSSEMVFCFHRKKRESVHSHHWRWYSAFTGRGGKVSILVVGDGILLSREEEGKCPFSSSEILLSSSEMVFCFRRKRK